MQEETEGELAARIAMTRRPEGQPVVMRQVWEQILFLHWPIEPAAVQRLLPPGLVVDTFDGQAYVGLVPFAMRGVRPVWSPSVPGLSAFLEVNVRTYVRREDGSGPGVWFFSLDAANPVAVALARGLWKLPYYWARMLLICGTDGEVTYRSERLRRTGEAKSSIGCQVRYAITGEAAPAEPGSLPYFLAERYLLYAYDGRRLWSGRVWHTPYPLQSARVLDLDDTLVHASGIDLPPDASRPDVPLAHYASGVDVYIFPLKPV
jgi:hypothetical protein